MKPEKRTSAFEPFDWRHILELPPEDNSREGVQLFRFICKDKPYTENPEAVKFVDQYLGKANKFKSDADVL